MRKLEVVNKKLVTEQVFKNLPKFKKYSMFLICLNFPNCRVDQRGNSGR